MPSDDEPVRLTLVGEGDSIGEALVDVITEAEAMLAEIGEHREDYDDDG